jgi:hypothetical protein
MSENLKNGHNQEGFETEDLSPIGIFYFMAGLAVVCLLIYFIVAGMYRFLDAYDRNHQPPTNPMAVKTGVDPRTMNAREVQQRIDNSFPRPVLEHNERTQFGEILEKQDRTLASYDWVDQKNGVVRIPIDKAMELLVQRGLPVLPPGGAAPAAATAKRPTSTKPAQKSAAPGN